MYNSFRIVLILEEEIDITYIFIVLRFDPCVYYKILSNHMRNNKERTRKK